jgi:D-3-phosphoglycerate dehydrogenase
MAATKILVTPRSLTSAPPAVIGRLREAGFEVLFSPPGKLPDEADLLALLPGCAGWLAGVEPVSERVIDAARELRVISRNGTGIDNLPAERIASRGIRVLRAEGANAIGVAELAIGLMLAGLRHIPSADAGIKSGGWPRRQGGEINGRTVGIIGCGAVGRHVAHIVVAMGARVLGFDPARPALNLPAESFTWKSMEEVLGEADIVSLHCPPRPDGRPIVDRDVLRKTRSDTVIVNTARATLVDEEAVLAALDQNRLGAYATDVFDEEPPRSRRLVAHERVIATSHIGGLTQESVAKATEIAVANLMAALAETGQ